MEPAYPISPKKRYWLFFLMLPTLIIGMVDRDVWTPDEPRVTAIAEEMVNSGQYLIPHLAGKPFVEKPPLYFASAGFFIHVLSPFYSEIQAVRFSNFLWIAGISLFTYLLSLEFFDSWTGFYSLLVLGTMYGFIQNAHWARVDIALSFWFVGYTYFLIRPLNTGKGGSFIWAGVFCAGAFLTKGLIGPVMMGLVSVTIVIYFLLMPKDERGHFPPRIWFPALGVICFLTISMAWIYYLYHNGGAELFHEWFWDNHVGRFTGAVKSLGHQHRNPVYYVPYLLIYTFPWCFFILFSFYGAVKSRKLTKETLFSILPLLIIGLLTIPSTKRDIYILPVLPFLAIAGVRVLAYHSTKWVVRLTKGILVLMGTLATLFLIISVFGSQLDLPLNAASQSFLSSWGWHQTISLIAFVLGAVLLRKFRFRLAERTIIIASVFYIMLLCIPFQILDREKSPRTEIIQLLHRIEDVGREDLVGYQLSETVRAYLYLWGHFPIHNETNSVAVRQSWETGSPILVSKPFYEDFLGEPDCEVLLEVHLRHHPLFLIRKSFEGAKPSIALMNSREMSSE